MKDAFYRGFFVLIASGLILAGIQSCFPNYATTYLECQTPRGLEVIEPIDIELKLNKETWLLIDNKRYTCKELSNEKAK